VASVRRAPEMRILLSPGRIIPCFVRTASFRVHCRGSRRGFPVHLGMHLRFRAVQSRPRPIDLLRPPLGADEARAAREMIHLGLAGCRKQRLDGRSGPPQPPIVAYPGLKLLLRARGAPKQRAVLTAPER
jgi:hypothetical protein